VSEVDARDDLLTRARGGDLSAFAELVRTFERLVFSLGLRMLANRQSAEDLAQEVFLQLHQHLAEIESGSHLAFWLRRVAAHRAIDRLRRQPEGEVELSEADSVVHEADTRDPMLEHRLRLLVAQLSPAARAVILLRYQEDLDPNEIARTLDMPVNTVKSHLKRSLTVLRTRILEADASRHTEAAKRGLPT
jgi:RNA polymerase sigma-70 factor (ECF subfamily)